MARREFRLQEGTSNKYWTIEWEGSGFTVQYGRIGATGQSQFKLFPTEAEAQQAHDRLIAEKLHKGYQEITPDAAATDRVPAQADTPRSLDMASVNFIGVVRVLATDAEVSALETWLKTTLPAGYREYVTTLGEGVLGGSFVRVYSPWRIEQQLAGWRQRIAEYWFWERSRSVLSRERALESILITDTLNGDELIFHPQQRDRLLILPVESEKIYKAGSSLLEAVEWMCSSGKLTRRFKARNFEPFDSRNG